MYKVSKIVKSFYIIRIVFSFFVITFSMLSTELIAQTKNSQNTPKFPKVEIDGTQVRKIFSKINNQEYVLQINLPRFYDDSSKVFPVVYLLDSQWDFPLLQAIYGQQYFDGFLPGLVVVGITWGGKDPNPDVLRARDFTPTDIHEYSPTGNAPNFLEFIKSELIPFIEKNYRVSKNDRTLMGSSLGGLLTLYTVFNRHDLFNRYVLTSPALSWDNGFLYQCEENYSKSSDKLPVKLAMCVGGLENNSSEFQDFVKKLNERNYKGLELYSKVIDGIGHSGSKAEGYTRGLQFVFSKKSIIVDQSILQDYVGEYQISAAMKINVKIENGQLVVEIPNNPNINLLAETDSIFYTKGQFTNVNFVKNSSGKVAGFNLEQYGGNMFVKKID